MKGWLKLKKYRNKKYIFHSKFCEYLKATYRLQVYQTNKMNEIMIESKENLIFLAPSKPAQFVCFSNYTIEIFKFKSSGVTPWGQNYAKKNELLSHPWVVCNGKYTLTWFTILVDFISLYSATELNFKVSIENWKTKYLLGCLLSLDRVRVRNIRLILMMKLTEIEWGMTKCFIIE